MQIGDNNINLNKLHVWFKISPPNWNYIIKTSMELYNKTKVNTKTTLFA